MQQWPTVSFRFYRLDSVRSKVGPKMAVLPTVSYMTVWPQLWLDSDKVNGRRTATPQPSEILSMLLRNLAKWGFCLSGNAIISLICPYIQLPLAKDI